MLILNLNMFCVMVNTRGTGKKTPLSKRFQEDFLIICNIFFCTNMISCKYCLSCILSKYDVFRIKLWFQQSHTYYDFMIYDFGFSIKVGGHTDRKVSYLLGQIQNILVIIHYYTGYQTHIKIYCNMRIMCLDSKKR